MTKLKTIRLSKETLARRERNKAIQLLLGRLLTEAYECGLLDEVREALSDRRAEEFLKD